MDWSAWPNFQKSEFDCKETGQNFMRPEFMDVLQKIRTEYGKPMIISSGYRSIHHSEEVTKPLPGEHTYGLAADILISGKDALELVKIAIAQGITRLGINQHGEIRQRFIHLGMADKFYTQFPSAIWSY